MAVDAEEPKTAQSLTSEYVCTGLTVQGLSTGVFNKAKYSVRVTIDGKDVWEHTEFTTGKSTIVWDGEANKHNFICARTTILRVTLWKCDKHGSVKEVRTAELSLAGWLDALEADNAIPLVRSQDSKLKSSVRVKLFIVENTKTNAESGTDALVRLQAVENAVAGAEAMHLISGPDKFAVKGPATDIESAWKPLLDNLEWFVQVMNVVTEVHPYAKMAWSVLSAAYKVVHAQKERDDNVADLVEKMKDVYAFIREARELDVIIREPRRDVLREKALIRLASQTVECAHFISTYTQDKTFLSRLVKQVTPGNDEAIVMYKASFEKLKQDFRDGSQLTMEIVTFRMAGRIEDLTADVNLDHIPYVDGAGYNRDKRCLPGTRVALLDEITNWAISDRQDTPRVFVLMGPAGTGKSAIAHTIAIQFEETQQLGSTFCFVSTDVARRTPASLFRNMAHDLYKGRPSFKGALYKSIKDNRHDSGTTQLDTQFEKFLLAPAGMLAVSGTIIIIVDALDESGTEQERAKLLSVLGTRLHELPVTFRFLLTCRPEPDIVQQLSRSPSGIHMRWMPTVHKDPQLSSDILGYVRSKLSEKSGSLPRGLDDRCCEELRDGAEGLFQWAFVACEYINGKRILGKTEYSRYKELMKSTRDDIRSPLKDSSLYKLYSTVIASISEDNIHALDLFKFVMGFVLTAVEPLSKASLKNMMSLLQPEEPFASEYLEEDTVLPLLASVLSGVSEDNAPIRVLHSSFAEMLLDPQGGGQYSVGADGHHERLLVASLRLLKSCLHFNMGDLQSSYVLNRDVHSAGQLEGKVPEDLFYACRYWGYHLSRSTPGFEGNGLVVDLVHHLLMRNILFWLDAASIAGIVGDIPTCLSCAMSRLSRMGDDAWAMAADAVRFVRRFARVIADSAAHIYLSAWVWLPAASKIAGTYGRSYVQTARVVSAQAVLWPNLEFVIAGHTAWVQSVAFSPDGKRIASGSGDRTIRIWNAETGEAIGEPLSGHTEYVHSVAFSPDGKRIASGSHDSTIRIWNAETGEAIGEPLSGHTASVYLVTFSPDGKRIASGSGDSTIRIWNAETGEAIGEPLFGHTDLVYSVAFAPDGKRIVSGSCDSTIWIWNAETGEAIGEPLSGHTDWVNSVAFSPDSKRIASGSRDSTIRIWNAETGEAIGEPLSGHTDWVNSDCVQSVAFSPDGQRIAFTSRNEIISSCMAETWDALGDPLATDHERLTDRVARTWPSHVPRYPLSLSPAPEHQLSQFYGSRSAEEEAISFNFETGWIMGNGRDHLLWVPPDEMLRLYTGQTQVVIPGPTIHVDLSSFLHGTSWTRCYQPPV